MRNIFLIKIYFKTGKKKPAIINICLSKRLFTSYYCWAKPENPKGAQDFFLSVFLFQEKTLFIRYKINTKINRT